jgi:hypothetical protein
VPSGRAGKKTAVPVRHALPLLLAVALASCGGPIADDELQRGIETLGATAAEGRLVALDVAEDRTKVTFTRVHARDLGDQAGHEAEKLADAQSQTGNVRVRNAAISLARDVSDALGELQLFPADRVRARAVARKLQAYSDQADQLTGRL